MRNRKHKETMRFELDADQILKYEAWTLEQDKLAVTKQKLETPNPDAFTAACWDAGHPYYGAIGGSDTFSFTMTSLGNVVKVFNSYTENEIDLTDYGSW